MKTRILIIGTRLSGLASAILSLAGRHPLALANASDVTVETLREQVREAAQSDSRFMKGDTANGSTPMVWVQDLIAPLAPGETWKAVIQATDNKSYQVSFTVTDSKIVLADDAKEVVRRFTYETLGNGEAGIVSLANELDIDEEGWALLAPYGEHIKERSVNRDGKIVRERFVQIVDGAAVDAVLANEKGDGLFSWLKRALVKRPIYNDHPDLKLYAPETVTIGNTKPLIPLGVNGDFRKTSRGLEFKPLITPDGANTIKDEGCKYPSALFLLQRTGVIRDGGIIEVRPISVASIGLTPFPNISGVDSLANAKPNTPAATTSVAPQRSAQEQAEKEKAQMKLALITWLAAQGVTLANSVGDTEVIQGLQNAWNGHSSRIVTLENSLSTERRGRINLTVDLVIAQGRLDGSKRSDTLLALGNCKPELLEAEIEKLLKLPENTALSNSVTALENSLKTERNERIKTLVDLIITQGKIEVAKRDDTITVLGNCKAEELQVEIEKLDKLPVKFALANAAAKTDTKEKGSAAVTKSAGEQLIFLANHDDRYKSLPYVDAYNKACADHPSLVEQLKNAPKV